jgi:hypothetical protein
MLSHCISVAFNGNGEVPRVKKKYIPMMLQFFLNPSSQQFNATLDNLSAFGHASSMITNLQKCVVYPIACDPSSLVDLLDGITCEFKAFPCKHLVRL